MIKANKGQAGWLRVLLPSFALMPPMAVIGAESQMEEVVIIGSRLPDSVATMPISVNIVTAEDLDKQAKVSRDLEEMLANLVPGLSLSSQSTINTYTSLRGRKPVFLVDGIPVTSTLNDVSRELRLIDPLVIERIEVVRGSSALFGNSAGAGFINYITKRGESGPPGFTTEVGSAFSLTHFNDSLQPSLRAALSGGSDSVDYLAQVYYEETDSFFDANGDRIPPQPDGLSDSTFRSFFGKLGHSWSAGRVEGTVSYYKHEQDAQYRLVPGSVALRQPTTTVAGGRVPGEEPRSNESLVAGLLLNIDDVLGSSVVAQVYYLDTESVFQFVANRFPLTDMPDGQSANQTTKRGGRLDFHTPLHFFDSSEGVLLWGVDYLHDDTKIPLTDGRDFGIPQTLETVAGFLQAQLQLTPRLSLTAGVRHEESDLEIKDFLSLFTLKTVTGGTLDYSATPINAGAVFSLNETIDLFLGYSQGFEVQQLSFLWRSTPVDVVVGNADPDPNLIDSYEAGLRFDTGTVSGSITGFYAENSDGVSFILSPTAPNDATPVRAPDRVYGIEAAADWQINNAWRLGGSAAWMEGDADRNNDGSFETPLQNRRIPPAKVTAYVEYDLNSRWYARLQGIYWGSRNEFPNSVGAQVFHEGEITSGFTMDLMTTYSFSSSEISLGVNNLLNSDYYTNYSEGFNRNDAFNKATGATAVVKYTVNF